MSIPGFIPSSFLPQLPRSRSTLDPLHPTDLLAHIAVLRELYLPPIHGGFTAADVFEDEVEAKVVRAKKRERRFSAGLIETMSGVGLGLDVPLDPAAGLEVHEEDVLAEEEEELLEEDDEEDEEEAELPHLDPFEREWSDKWLGGIVRRAQGWIEEHEGEESGEVKDYEALLREATAVMAMMAGTSAAGSLTRHLVFPIEPSLAPALKQLRSNTSPNPALSPETNTFLASLSASPTSPISHLRSASADLSSSPTSTSTISRATRPRSRAKSISNRRAVLPILLHDAPMGDHLSVGVQTWGSAILLGRQVALRPVDYGLFLPLQDSPRSDRGVRVLELGAGTGLLSILCRKLLDLRAVTEGTAPGLVVATDFLESVLDNLKICVDLNFPPQVQTAPASGTGTTSASAGGGRSIASGTDKSGESGIHIAKLDWTTFPAFMASNGHQGEEEMRPFIFGEADGKGEGKSELHAGETTRASASASASASANALAEANAFDLVLASDCVYDETHARLLREVASWVLKLPDEEGKGGGTFHILSPLRPTFAPELQSIEAYFPPLSSYRPLAERRAAANNANANANADVAAPSFASGLGGEGLGIARGLKLGARGEGKRQVKGRRGEGRVDENQGYWWWEVGWG